MSDKLSELQMEERRAISRNIGSTLNVVSALRRYRAAAKRLIASRVKDGGCSDESLSKFAEEVALIESLGEVVDE